MEQQHRDAGFGAGCSAVSWQGGGGRHLFGRNYDFDRLAQGSGVLFVPRAWAYRTCLEISAKDRDGLALDVAMALSTQKVKVNNLSARSQPDGYALVSLELSVKDQQELAGVIRKLSQIQGVFLVKRAGS